MSSELLEKARKICLLGLDVDGVLTDGHIYYGNSGEQFRAFHTQDGFGLQQLKRAGIEIAIITSKSSNAVFMRAQELGISHLYQGQSTKLEAFDTLLSLLKLTPDQAAFVGDDLLDLPLIEKAGLGIAVANAVPEVIANSDWTTQKVGGFGAIREVCDLLLKAKSLG